MTRRLRSYAVAITLHCTRCTASDTATVEATSCEDARQLAMRVIRYRGWYMEKGRADQYCPTHAPVMQPCALCQNPTPGAYMDRLDEWWVTDDPKTAALPRGARCCDSCMGERRTVAFARRRAESNR